MAIDPTELAQEQEQRQRVDVVGAPTEFAKGPEREGVEVAAVGNLLKLFGKLPGPVKPTKPKVKPDAATPPDVLPQRPPTVAEQPIAEQTSPLYSYQDVQRQVAPQVLEPPALEEFERRGFQAFPNPDQSTIDQAKIFLEEDADKAAKTAENIKTKAKGVITKQQSGFSVRPENLLSGERTKSVLERLEEMKTDLKSIKDGGDFNFDLINTGEDLHYSIQTLSEEFADEIDLTKRGIITQEQTIEEAAKIVAEDEFGFTKELLNRKIGDGSFNAAKTLAARQLLVKNMERLLDIHTKIKTDMVKTINGDGNVLDTDLFAFRKQLTIQAAIQMQVKGNQTEAARTLNSFNIPVSGEDQALQTSANANRLLQESGGKEVAMEMVERFGQIAESEEGIGGINRFAIKAYLAKTKEVIHQAYMAGLLSNPATQMKNILGTGSYMLYQIPSEVLAGAFGAAYRKGAAIRGVTVNPDQVYMRDALLRMKGWSDSFKDALSAASLAFRTEMPSGGKNRYDLEIYNPVGEAEETFFSKSLSHVGKTVRLPFRFLLGADEFFKVMSSRGELYTAVSRRYGDLILQGKTDEEALAEAGMLLLDPKAVDEILDEKAKYDTMQSDLGSLKKATGLVQNNFFGRFILPFATAPTNSMFRVVENSPLGAYKAIAPSFMPGAGKTPRERQLAAGRAFLGSASMWMFSEFAAEGRITGSRPRNKAAREALPPGWQPYSFVIRDEGFPDDTPLYDDYGRPNGPLKYISYAGFEPVGAIIGISADYAQQASELPPGQGTIKYLTDRAAIGTSAISEYMSELPMLKGMADIVDAMRGEGLENIFRSYPQSATPLVFPNIFSGLQRGIYDLADPNVVKPRKDVQYWTLEEVMAKDEDGNYIHGITPAGEPKGLRKLGTVKDSVLDKVLSSIDSYQDMDSYFSNQYDTNAILYDTLGNEIKSTSLSIANNPIGAIRNRILGIRIDPDQELTASESELMRLYGETGRWGLSNKESLNGIPLSFGAQSDWTMLAKGVLRDAEGNPLPKLDLEGNEVKDKEGNTVFERTQIRIPMFRNINLNFSDALTLLTKGELVYPDGAVITDVFTNYQTASSDERLALIGRLEDQFYNATISKLFEVTDSQGNLRHKSLRKVYEDKELQKDLEGMLNR